MMTVPVIAGNALTNWMVNNPGPLANDVLNLIKSAPDEAFASVIASRNDKRPAV